MKLRELAAYAEEEYLIREEENPEGSPGITALTEPRTGRTVAVLIRQWDPDTGEQLEFCDLRISRQATLEYPFSWITSPHRMSGSHWTGVRFGEETDADIVCLLLDRAVNELAETFPDRFADRSSHKNRSVPEDSPIGKAAYGETPIPPRPALNIPGVYRGMSSLPQRTGKKPRPSAPKETDIPEKIREMRKLCPPGYRSYTEKIASFRIQAEFMENYEDNAPWEGSLRQYFPTYQDLGTDQLRGYFTWRTALRRGEYRPACFSFACIYLYELLNGIGARSPEDALRKLKAFADALPVMEFNSPTLEANLRKWMPEYAVLRNVPAETAQRYMDPDILEEDRALAALRTPEEYTDAEICAALGKLSGNRTFLSSPVLKKCGPDGEELFAGAWKAAAAGFHYRESDLFTSCFGLRRTSVWYPLSGAIYFTEKPGYNGTYALGKCRTYTCRNGRWTESAYQSAYFDRQLLNAFLHETDRRLRLYFETGRPLREKAVERWASPYVEEAIRSFEEKKREAAKPRIDFGVLDNIRRDALITQDSLIVEEEDRWTDSFMSGGEPARETAGKQAWETAGKQADGQTCETAEDPDFPLTPALRELLIALLRGDTAEGILSAHRLMPAIAADALNEALFDEIGDNVIDCDGAGISIVEEYRQDLLHYLETEKQG